MLYYFVALIHPRSWSLKRAPASAGTGGVGCAEAVSGAGGSPAGGSPAAGSGGICGPRCPHGSTRTAAVGRACTRRRRPRRPRSGAARFRPWVRSSRGRRRGGPGDGEHLVRDAAPAERLGQGGGAAPARGPAGERQKKRLLGPAGLGGRLAEHGGGGAREPHARGGRRALRS